MTTTVVDLDPVAGLRAEVGALVAQDATEWTLGQLEAALPEMFTLANQLFATQLKMIAAFDAFGGGQLLGHRNTGDWLAQQALISKGRAGWLVHAARAVRDELPATEKALQDGEIGEDHLRAIRRVRRVFGPELTAALEQRIVDVASHNDPTLTRRFVDAIIQQYSPEASDDEAECQREKRYVHLSESMDGWWHVDGLLDAASGAEVAAALEVFAQSTGRDDRRNLGARRCDALAEIAGRALDETDRPTGLGHITLTLTPDQLASGIGVSWPSGCSPRARTSPRGRAAPRRPWLWVCRLMRFIGSRWRLDLPGVTRPKPSALPWPLAMAPPVCIPGARSRHTAASPTTYGTGVKVVLLTCRIWFSSVDITTVGFTWVGFYWS